MTPEEMKAAKDRSRQERKSLKEVLEEMALPKYQTPLLTTWKLTKEKREMSKMDAFVCSWRPLKGETARAGLRIPPEYRPHLETQMAEDWKKKGIVIDWRES